MGYRNIEVSTADGTRVYVKRQPNADEVGIVQRIFEMYASGKGLTRIAKTLNADGIAPPRHGLGWAPSAIREMLHRRLYRGEIVWNEHQKIIRGGTKQRRRRAEAEWVRVEVPELRIISTELWDTVHTRLQHAAASFGRDASGRLIFGPPARKDVDSPYLLSGLARCATCGGSICGLTRYGRARGRFYGCSYYQKRGTAICGSAAVVPQAIVDEALLAEIERHMDPRVMERAVELLWQRQEDHARSAPDRRHALERELVEVDRQVAHLVNAIARGEAVEPLLVGLKAQEARKRALAADLQGLRVPDRLDRAKLLPLLRGKLADVQGLLHRHPSQARQVLRKLVDGYLICQAVEVDGVRGYRITGRTNYLPLLPAGLVVPTMVASPTGFEPVLPA